MNKEVQRFRKLLKKKGYFATRQRVELFTLFQKHTAATIDELITLLHKQDQATIYRNIKVFEELGVINRLQFGGHAKLELSDVFQHHHHHMSCVHCGRVYVLKDNQLIENEIRRVSASGNFMALDHQLEIRGLCKNCQ